MAGVVAAHETPGARAVVKDTSARRRWLVRALVPVYLVLISGLPLVSCISDVSLTTSLGSMAGIFLVGLDAQIRR